MPAVLSYSYITPYSRWTLSTVRLTWSFLPSMMAMVLNLSITSEIIETQENEATGMKQINTNQNILWTVPALSPYAAVNLTEETLAGLSSILYLPLTLTGLQPPPDPLPPLCCLPVSHSRPTAVSQSPSHLCGSTVLPAGGDMSDDAGVALLAYVDAVHLDDALARVETGDGCHRAWPQEECERERGEEGSCLSGVDEDLSEGCDSDHTKPGDSSCYDNPSD
ncbi:hypothetical protein EYF80_000805 [Liparis tanakae]|uniref:Uncharacterized protein n=1 Tax=Liparis tanakae TaxID=230148 RepID=A0A4Z2JG11_9TELE|nr:hypothetical protein EYF80_000805 [Liparis tanakae]